MLLVTALKCVQLLPNGLGGLFMLSDCVHGKAHREFVGKLLGFPPWFCTMLGVFKLSQTALNWMRAGLFTRYAQLMMAFELGGAMFTHGVLENRPAGMLPPLVFLVTTVGVQTLDGHLTSSLILILILHSCCTVAGFFTGFLIAAAEAKRRKTRESRGMHLH